MKGETVDDGENLRMALTESQSQNEALADEVKRLREELTREKEQVKEMWKMNCAQLSGFDETLSAKDAEIEALKERVSRHETFMEPSSVMPQSPTSEWWVMQCDLHRPVKATSQYQSGLWKLINGEVKLHRSVNLSGKIQTTFWTPGCHR